MKTTIQEWMIINSVYIIITLSGCISARWNNGNMRTKINDGTV